MDLRMLRFTRGLTQLHLSYLSGVSQPVISLVELGYRRPSQDEIKKFAKALAVKPDEINFDQEPKNGKPQAA